MCIVWFIGLPLSLPLGCAMAFLYFVISSTFRSFASGKLDFSLDFSKATTADWKVMGLIVLSSILIFLLINLKRKYVDQVTDFRPGARHVTDLSTDKRNAQRKPVPHEYLGKDPGGLTVGRYVGKYVNIPFLASPEHQLILGAPGSQKSVTLKNALLSNFNFEHDCRSILAIDVKPELSRDTVFEGRDDVAIINPAEIIKGRSGFNVYYGLSPASSDDAFYDRFSLVAGALIANPGGDNAFFYEAAIKLLTAFLMYNCRKGISFAESVCRVTDQKTEDFIAEILMDPAMDNHPRITRLLREFDGKTSDAAQDVAMTLQKNLSCFDYRSVKHCFDTNPNKVSPVDLELGKSIFLALPDHLLEQYSPVFRLITELCLSHLLSRLDSSRTDKRPYWILVDEAGSIGKIPSLLPAMARGRSKGIMATVVAQSYAQLDQTYGTDGAITISDCCKTTIVLSCNNVKTAEELSKRTGTYRETKLSSNTKPGMASGVTSTTESSEYRSVMDVADIAALERDERALVFARGSWFVVKKAPFYTIKAYKSKSDGIRSQNAPFYPELDL